jgi:(p)ppGpp synthase/HD superfamily hydrolase
MMEAMDTEQDRSVVLLHDVVEHLAHELDEIKVKFRTEIRDAVDTMAERDDKAYLKEFVPQARENEIVQNIERADIETLIYFR